MNDIEMLAYRRGESLKAANKQIDELLDDNASLKARAEKAEAEVQRLKQYLKDSIGRYGASYEATKGEWFKGNIHACCEALQQFEGMDSNELNPRD